MNDLNMNMFAFLTWLERNKEAHTLDGLMMSDGYGWYNEQWKCWLKNSDAGREVLANKNNHLIGEEITWWGGKPDMDNVSGETTIEFPRQADLLVPKQHKPEPYNPNRAQLDTMEFKFYQEANCVDGGDGEELTVEAKSSLGIDSDGGAFYVLKTEQWAINDIDDLIVMLKRVEAALDAVKPTSIHVK